MRAISFEFFFFSSRRRHTRLTCDWSSDVCSSDLAVLFNIFGGITRCDEVANGLVEAFNQLNPQVPFVVRLDGTNDVEGRQIVADANLPNVTTASTMNEAAEKVVELAR